MTAVVPFVILGDSLHTAQQGLEKAFTMMNRYARVIAILLLGIGMVCGQAKPPDPALRDSLRKAIRTQKGEKRVDAVLRLASGYMRDSLDKSMFLIRNEISNIYEDAPTELPKALDLLGRGHFMKGELLRAIFRFEAGFGYAEDAQDTALMAHLSNSLGVAHIRLGAQERALEYLTRSLNYWTVLKDPFREVHTLINIGALQSELEEYDQAIRALEKAIQRAQDMETVPLEASARHNLGTVYEQLENFDQALKYYQQSLALYRKNGPVPHKEAPALGNIHNILAAQGKDETARQYYLQALEMAQSINSEGIMQRLLMQRGDVFFDKKQYRSALTLYQQSLSLAEKLSLFTEQERLHQKLAESFSLTSQHQTAAFHYKRVGEIRKQIYEDNNAIYMAEMQAEYELGEIEKELLEMEANRRTREWQIVGLLTLVAFFLVAFAALYNRYRTRKRTQLVLEEKHEEIAKQNQLLGIRHREIQQKNQLLEDQSRAIKAQNQQLLQSNEELEQLAYAASHDLREPLRTIISYLQLLSRKQEDKLDESGKEFLRYASEGSQRLKVLLDDLLAYSRVGRVQPNPEEIALEKIIEQVRQSLKATIDESEGKIFTKDLPVIKGYPTGIYLLFQNLISNAIKFHADGRRPIIHISATYEKGYHLIAVHDNGIGIEHKHQDRVFQMFQRLHPQGVYEGTGVGLTLCQKIVRNHGGHIWFESATGEGTTFWIKLPARPPQQVLPPKQ